MVYEVQYILDSVKPHVGGKLHDGKPKCKEKNEDIYQHPQSLRSVLIKQMSAVRGKVGEVTLMPVHLVGEKTFEWISKNLGLLVTVIRFHLPGTMDVRIKCQTRKANANLMVPLQSSKLSHISVRCWWWTCLHDTYRHTVNVARHAIMSDRPHGNSSAFVERLQYSTIYQT